MASYLLLDIFEITIDENNELKESYFNVYSSFVNHIDYLIQNKTILNFTINYNNEDYTKKIFIGDIKYTKIEGNDQYCYNIYNDTYQDINKITN